MRTIGHHRLFPILLILAVAVTTRAVVAQDSVEQLWQQGNAAETSHEYHRAEEIWRKVLQIDSNNARAYYNLGNTLRQQKKLDEAIVAYQKTLQLNPNDADAYNNLGIVLGEQKKLDEEIVAYQKALQLNPNNAEAYYNLGVALKNQKKFDRAIAAFEKVVQLNPNDADAYNNLGIALYHQNKFDRAIIAYQKATQFNPNNAEAYYNLGVALYRQQKFDRAIVAYQKAIQLNPNYGNAYINLGNALSAQRKFDQAIVAYQKAIQMPNDYYQPSFPTNVRAAAYINLGIALYHQNKFDRAIAAYQKAIQINPNDAAAYNNLGNALYRQQKFDQAIAVYQKAIQIKPNDGNTYINLGNAMSAQRKFDQAITAYQKALQTSNYYQPLFPTNVHAGAYNGLGIIFQEQSKLKESIDFFDKAESLDPDYAYASSNYIEARRLWTEQRNNLAKVENDRQWLPLDDPNLKIKRSVVQITSTFSTRERQGIEMGTGIVIDRSNNQTLILTARHVVFDGDVQGENIQVEFFSTPPSNRVRMRRDASLLKNTTNDRQVDLVLLEVNGQLPDDIQPIAMSQTAIAIDRSVQIIGHFVQKGEYLPWSLKAGKVQGYDENQRLIISQAKLKQGFSGAPLLDDRNLLLGIAIEIRGDKQQDYAYPISIIKKQLSTWKISLKP
jgi:tetratricopeptide (TPR) repeat protein